MSVRLDVLCIRASDPHRLARFWAELLGWEPDLADATRLRATDDTGFGMRFEATDSPRVGLNQTHLHLTSAVPGDQERTVQRVLDLGGRHLDVGQLPEEGHVVLADPDGNELCVIEHGNRWLAGCGFLGELACDGTPEVGRFWSQTLDWPLVWDQDGETAVRSPHGGPRSRGAVRRSTSGTGPTGCSSSWSSTPTCRTRSTGWSSSVPACWTGSRHGW